MRRTLLLLLVLAAACTGSPTVASTPSATTSTGDEPTPTPSRGVLVLDVSRGCCYREGSFFYLKVRTDTGEVVVDRRYGAAQLEFIVREKLPPGSYSILTYERPCEGGCPKPFRVGALDPPASRCERTVTIRSGEKNRIRVVTVPGHDCGTY